MKNLRITLCLLPVVFIMSAGGVYAQKPGSLTGGFETQSSFNSGNEFKTMEFAADAGVNATKWMAVTFRAGTSVGMFDTNDTKTYRLVENLGGNLIFSLLKTGYGTLTLNVSAGSTVGSKDWRYAYYSGGVYFNVGKRSCKPFIGAGIKYYDTYKRSEFDDYLRFYLSFGVRLF